MKVSVLIDSHGWIEYFSEGPLAAKYAKFIDLANKEEYFTPSIVLYEVYKKIKLLKDEDTALKAFACMIAHTTIIPIGKKLAMKAADISLKTKLAMADSIIKAVAEYKNAKIITGDKHFKGFENVVFIE